MNKVSQKTKTNTKINVFTQKLFLFELGHIEDLEETAIPGHPQVLLLVVEEAVNTESIVLVCSNRPTLGIRPEANKKTLANTAVNKLCLTFELSGCNITEGHHGISLIGLWIPPLSLGQKTGRAQESGTIVCFYSDLVVCVLQRKSF